jgi:hypothetical protein
MLIAQALFEDVPIVGNEAVLLREPDLVTIAGGASIDLQTPSPPDAESLTV